MQPSLSLDAVSRACAPERASLGRRKRSAFGRERRRCLQRRGSASPTSTTSTSTPTFALLHHLAGSALDGTQFAIDKEYFGSAASDLTSSVERIFSSAGATSSSSSSSFSSSNFYPASIFDTADLATAGAVLNFLLHHPLVSAAAALFAVFAIPRLVQAVAKNVVLPVAALGLLLVVLAAPEASLGAAKGLIAVAAAHPVACSALILAAAGVALSPYLLLVAAVMALVWGVPKLPAPLRPRFFSAPIAAEARAAFEAAKEKFRFDSSFFVEGGKGAGDETTNSAAAVAAVKEAARELEKIKQAVELPARSTAAAVSRVAGRAKAATSAVRAAAGVGARAIGEVGRCRSEPTAAERVSCVRQQEADLVDRRGGGGGG